MIKKIPKNKLACLGEKLASNYYQNLGYTLLGQNLTTPYGEIDLLLNKQEKIIIVEVKTRSNQNYGLPEEAINRKKIKNIENSWAWLQKKFNYFNLLPSIEICSIQLKNKQAKIKRFLL